METLEKHWKLISGIIVGISAVATWIFSQGANSRSLEGKVFDSPEQKVEIITHVEDAPSPKQLQLKHLRDSINTAHAMKSRSKRDSAHFEELRRRHVTDSINQLNADQIYQIKQEFKEIKELLKRNN